MQLELPERLGENYTSPTQKARVITEAWAKQNLFCPCCTGNLEKAPNNLPATDLYCRPCSYAFELKSKKGRIGPAIVDGAYATMISRIRADSQPNLVLLSYDNEYRVKSLKLIPSFFLVEGIVEKRKPLAATARRAGWTGCNLRVDAIPRDGHLNYVCKGIVAESEAIRIKWKEVLFLRDFDPTSRGWLISTMAIVRRLEKTQFKLSEIYQFESELQQRFPDNRHIRAKIRQQLQVLRDSGWLTFLGHGEYRRSQPVG